MPTLHDISPQKAIEKAAEKLKTDIKMPEWAKFVKTSTGKTNPPESLDWYHKRAASILRKIYLHGPIGTNKLKVKYSTKKNRGHKPEKFRKGSGKIIRSILQQLEAAGYIKKDKKGSHAGRVITPKGKSFLDKLPKNGTKSTGHTKPIAEPATEPVAAPKAN